MYYARIYISILCGLITKSTLFVGLVSLLTILCSILTYKGYLKWIISHKFSFSLIGILGVIVLVAGCSLNPRSIIFSFSSIIIYAIFLLSLGTFVLNGLWNIRRVPLSSLSIHLGAWLISLALGIGQCDKKEFNMSVTRDKVEWRGFNLENDLIELPVAIKLVNIEKKDKIYAEVVAFTKDGKEKKGIISVNNPLRLSGWNIYYNNYTREEEDERIDFMIVSDPWAYVLFLGMCLLGISCLFFILKKKK